MGFMRLTHKPHSAAISTTCPLGTFRDGTFRGTFRRGLSGTDGISPNASEAAAKQQGIRRLVSVSASLHATLIREYSVRL